MYKLFMIAKNNMKKQKGDMITFFILTLLSSFLIFNCLATLNGMGRVMDDRFDKINGSHGIVFIDDDSEKKECLEKAFKENEHIKEFETTPVTRIYGEYKNSKDTEWKEYDFLAESFGNEKKQMKILDIDASDYSENDIFVPLHMKAGYAIGDTLELKLGDNKYKFNVAGYAEDPYFSSTINITINYIYMSQKMIDKIVDENPKKALDYIAFKGRIDESELAPAASNVIAYMSTYGRDDGYYKTSDLEEEITGAYKDYVGPYMEKNPEKDYLSMIAVNWQMMRGGAQFLPMISMAIIMIFGILILVIALIIISFSIKNFIQRNMKNTGILEASGYTVKELRLTILVQIAIIALLGALVGVALAFVSNSKFVDVVSLLLGITWNQPIDYATAMITVISLLVMILLVTWFISRAYKKTGVLDELRGGINTHNFKRNHFTFEKTPLPISVVLSLKGMIGEIGKNVVMVIIIMILVISTLVGFGMMENFGSDPDSLTSIMGFDTGTALIGGSKDIEDDIKNLDGVEDVLVSTGFEPSVSHKDKTQNVYTYAYEDISKRPTAILVEGRYAKNDNEILVTTGVANDFNVGVGDVLTITVGDKNADYIITGIDQRMERMGRTICMTLDGAEKIGVSTANVSYTLACKEGVTFDDIESQIDDKDIETDSVIDIDTNMKSTLQSVSTAVQMLCFVIVLITILVVVFVEALVVRAKIVREWRTFGINKALGMTSSQIISQIMMSNVPGIIVGMFIGGALAQVVGSNLCIACFSLFGIRKIAFSISPTWYIATIVGIFVVAIITAGLFGLKTRTLEPVGMITEE